MIFIDTGAFLARYIQADQYFKKARTLWRALETQPCVTSQHVLDETVTLLARRTSYDFAAERAHIIYASSQLKILRSSEENEREAIKIFKKYADHKVSFTDALSCTLMRMYRIHVVFSFDTHFSMMGFHLFDG